MKLNPDLCPTHKCEMNWLPGGYVCEECRHKCYERITKLKLIHHKLKRIWWLSHHPTDAKLFEGL